MIDFNQWLLVSSVLAVLIWAQSLSLQASPLWWRGGSLVLPLAISLLLHDWLIRQSLSQWLQLLQPFSKVLAVGFSVMALLLCTMKHSRSIGFLPFTFLILCYWQLLWLQSGVLPWSFQAQLCAVAVLFFLLINVMAFLPLPAFKYGLIISQCVLSWWWFCQWPSANNHLTLSISGTAISVALCVLCVGAGVAFERWRSLKYSKENMYESIH